MTSTWLPVVGERIRPVTTAAEAVSPGGDPIPAPGEGPHWARLRWPPPSDGDDRREAMVSDAERTATLDPESMESGERRSVSVVWEDGGEDDGLDPATFGPCVDRSTPGIADEDPDARARAFAADARARGASRFRAGDDAAAAAEYVEACAMLASTLPAHALPATEGGWNVPGYPTPTDGGGGDAQTMRINSSATGAASSAASSAAPPTVGTRVRVTSADGSSRAGMVAYVEEEEGVCDVMFDEANDGEDDEEVGVPFSRLFGYDPSPGTDAAFDATNEDADEDDDARRRTRREAAAAAARDRDAVCDELASRLLDVARCHLRLARGGYIATERIVGKDGKRRDAWVPARMDAASARACVSACDAALLMRRTRAGYYLRGKARTQLCQFRGAEDDLRTALATRETSVGGESNPVGDVASEREVKLALRALKAAARHRRASDRKLASAVVSNAYKARVDFGLDPGSELERTGRVPGGPYLRPAHERKHDAVDVRGLGDVIKERVAERVKRGCVLIVDRTSGTAQMLGSDVAHLVALLKEPPFELHHLTGPRLGELGGEETRRLAADVFSKLSPPGAFQGSATGGTLAEEGERTTAKLLEFLRHVKYRPEGGDESAQRKAWQLGDHDVVLPALKWVLDNRDRCEKRAYVGHFMADYAVPGEYAMDPEIQDLMNNTHELQRAFVEAHKECEQARREAKDPVKLKSQIADLEREREQVRRRIEVTKGKVAQRVTDPRELDELVALAQSLREEQEQEHELARQTRDQTERRDLADRRRNRAATRIRELRTSLASGSPAALLQQLADEVNARKQLVEEKLPADLAKKRARLESVREILRSDVRTDSDIATQTSEVNKLSAEVRELEDELSEAMAKRDDDVQLRQQAQVAKTIAAKRASAVAKRDRLAQRRNQVVGEYESASARQEGDVEELKKGGRAATDPDEMKARFESVKAKLAKYKSLKRELDELNMEAAVLARTEAILEEDARGVMGDVAEEERRAGVAGFAQAQETLEQVSKAKGDVDAAKGAALEEINAFVAEITRKIKERKGALQPKIKELRDLRQHFGALESKHADAKKRYDVEAAKHQKKRDALESEVNQLRTQVLGDETKYHRMNIESALVEAHAKRATGGDARRYDAMYRAAVDETDNETKRLNERTEEVRNNFSQGVEAVEALKDLYRILDVKLRVTRRDMAGESLGQTTTYGGANVLSM